MKEDINIVLSPAFKAGLSLIHSYLFFDFLCVISSTFICFMLFIFFLSKALCSFQLVSKCAVNINMTLTSKCAAVKPPPVAAVRSCCTAAADDSGRWRRNYNVAAVSAGGRRRFPRQRAPGEGMASGGARPRPPPLRDEAR